MIVAEAGGSKATLYKYFSSKQALVAGLIDDIVEGINRNHPAFAVDDVPLREALTRVGRAVLDAVVSDNAVDTLRLALGEYNRFPELARTVWEHGPAVSYTNFRVFIERRQKRGELRYDDAQLTAEHFLAAIAGHIQLKVAMGMCEAPRPKERERRVEAAVDCFLARYGT